jgi:hypothetical protein
LLLVYVMAAVGVRDVLGLGLSAPVSLPASWNRRFPWRVTSPDGWSKATNHTHRLN